VYRFVCIEEITLTKFVTPLSMQWQHWQLSQQQQAFFALARRRRQR
jgi:predicted metal-binding membrane protein